MASNRTSVGVDLPSVAWCKAAVDLVKEATRAAVMFLKSYE